MISIQKASVHNIDSLTPLFDAYRVFYQKTTDIGAAHAFLTERMARKESEIFIANNENGQIVGFTQLYPLFSSTQMRRLWLLNDLYVIPSFRGQGISVALIEAAKAYCSETDACGILLETAKTNDIGNNLYPRAGFALDKDHHYYFWDNIAKA